MTDAGLTWAAALLLGLAASGHCMVMCGGITAALGMATAKRGDGRQRLDLLLAYQIGRIVSYTLAGLLFASAAGGAIALLDVESIRRALRVASAVAVFVGALVAFGVMRDPGARIGNPLWSKLAPLGRRLLPVASVPRALAFGAIWGWMPCGFVYTVLLIATLSLDPLRGAGTMAAFGAGTLPAMLIGSLGAQRLAGYGGHRVARKVAGSVLLASAALTLVGPWLTAPPWLHAWLPFDCALPVR